MGAHAGCFKILSAVIDCIPFVVCRVPHVEALKLIIYSSGQSILWNQRVNAYQFFLNTK